MTDEEQNKVFGVDNTEILALAEKLANVTQRDIEQCRARFEAENSSNRCFIDFNDPNWIIDGITPKESALVYVFGALLWGAILLPLIIGIV